MFTTNVEYEIFSLFYYNCKIISHNLSNCKRLQQDANVDSSRRKTIGAKIQKHYCPKVVSVLDYSQDSTMQHAVQHLSNEIQQTTIVVQLVILWYNLL